jgi:hypothetical protein
LTEFHFRFLHFERNLLVSVFEKIFSHLNLQFAISQAKDVSKFLFLNSVTQYFSVKRIITELLFLQWLIDVFINIREPQAQKFFKETQVKKKFKLM